LLLTLYLSAPRLNDDRTRWSLIAADHAPLATREVLCCN
jgi:hypothetical protein